MTKPTDAGAPPPPSEPTDAPPAGAPDPSPEPKPEAPPTPFKDRLEKLRSASDEELLETLRQKDAPAAEPPAPPAAEGGEDGDEPAGEPEGSEGEGEGEGGEPAAPPAAEGGEPPEDEDFVLVKLPGRRPEDGDFELPLDVKILEAAGVDPADAVERLNQLRNGAMRRAEFEEAKATLDTQQEELDGIYTAMAEDPASFIVENVDPSLQAAAAEAILMNLPEEDFAKIVRRIDTWARDPEERDTDRTKAENARLKAENTRTKQSGTVEAQRKLVRDISTAIRSVLPEDTDQRKARAFEREAAAELRTYAKENKLTKLDPAEIPEILAERGVLELFGIPANGHKAPAERGASGAPAKKGPGKNGDAKASSSAAPKAKAPDVRERLKRRQAATTTPAGAGGAAPAGFQKVPGESYSDRSDRLRRALGLPAKKRG